MEQTYMVRRFYFDESHPRHRARIKTGLTLAEAQAHCQNPTTEQRDPSTGHVIWFDGYDKEPSCGS